MAMKDAVLDENGHAIMDDEEDKDEVYLYFGFKYDLHRGNTHNKFNLTLV